MSALLKILAIARANLVRMLRDRGGLFFVFFLPVLIIVVLGLQFGGAGTPRVGVVDRDGGPFAGELRDALRSGAVAVDVRSYGDEASLGDAVARGFVELGIVIPDGYDAALRAPGETARIGYVGQATSVASTVREGVEAAVATQSALVRAARFAAVEAGIPFDEALAIVRSEQGGVAGVAIRGETVGAPMFAPQLSGFNIGAHSQLILFMFLTSMTAASQLILTRRFGISRRMLATPTGSGVIVLGELLGRFAIAMVQGLFIAVLSTIVFGVTWGNPIGAAALIVAFALFSTGAAMLVGVLVDNAEQAGSLGVVAGMVLGALGGAMVPPEVFPESMATVRLLVPHAWAVDGLRALVVRGVGVVDVLPYVVVLLGWAAALIGLASVRFRRAVVR